MKDRLPTLIQAITQVGSYGALIIEETNADSLNQTCEVFNKATGKRYEVKLSVKPK